MAVASTSSALRLRPLLLVLLLAATSEATTFKIINQCSYTVWPAALPGGGVKLDQGPIMFNICVNAQPVCTSINGGRSPTAESPLPAPPADVTPPTPSTLPAAIGPTSMKPKSSYVRRVVAILAPVGGFILLTIVFLIIFPLI